MDLIIKEKIRAFFGHYFQKTDLQDNQDIFALGFVNSLFAMQLVLFVENEFDITIDNDDLDIAHFRTLDAIAQLVMKKQAAYSAPTAR